jgi:murein DD-endopeptidase MepM/ murein hydrolase activator NlpD
MREVWIPHMDAGADGYSHIRSAPFDGTVMPIAYIPDWTKVANQDKTKRFEDIQISDYLSLPTYDPTSLQRDMNNINKMSMILHYTYTTPYMGSYRFNYKEHDGSHLGVDIRAPIGTPILSIAHGVVVRTVEADTTGNKFVVIRHDNVPVGGKMVSLYSGYLHLSQITVTEGTKVTK